MNKGRILIVEDNMDNYELVRFILERAGYDVFLAVNGRDGVDAARFQKPDLILMDTSLPGMDGLSATRILSQEEGTENIPIISLTALAMPGDRERCLEAGANEYMTKPVRLKFLKQIIENLLQG